MKPCSPWFRPRGCDVDPYLALFGLGVGVLVGMTGIGGGSLMTPLLILVFGVKPVLAVGTDLAYAAVTKTVGGYRHLRQGTVDLALAGWMAVGSVPAAIGGVWVLELLQGSHGDDFDDLMLKLLAAALIFTGAATLGRALFAQMLDQRERHSIDLHTRQKISSVVLGVLVGFVLGLTSAGSGALIAVGLILIFRLTPRRVVGTDVFHAAILLWAAAVAHVLSGNVDYALAGNILLGSVPGVWVGSRWSIRVPPEVLRTLLGVVLIGSGTGILAKAEVGVPPTILGAFPVLVALLAVAGALRDRRRRPGRKSQVRL